MIAKHPKRISEICRLAGYFLFGLFVFFGQHSSRIYLFAGALILVSFSIFLDLWRGWGQMARTGKKQRILLAGNTAITLGMMIMLTWQILDGTRWTLLGLLGFTMLAMLWWAYGWIVKRKKKPSAPTDVLDH
jgi:O-antigen/teichoic acid export membrane protein